MKIVLIGAGRLATHLGAALCRASHEVVQVYSRTAESAEALAALTGSEAVTDLNDVTTEAEVYVCAVKDAVLPSLLPVLCKGREDALFLHTAGSMPMDVFGAYARRYGVLYPMQTFSKERELDFSCIPCFVEANSDATLAVVERLARSISNNVRRLSSEDRRYLHLSAVFACNFVNHCYQLAADLLEEHDIPFETLLPLIDETAAKVHELHPRKAQTGPAVRYDENVIRRQADMLGGLSKEIYKLMSDSIHQSQTANLQSQTTKE